MIKYALNYINVFGEDVSETLYFNLTAAEIQALEFKYADQGGMSGRMKSLANDDITAREISEMFKELILESYGERVGNQFVKPDEAGRRNFLASEKFSLIYTRLVGVDENGKSENPFEFLVGIFPDMISKSVDLTDLNKQYDEMVRENGFNQGQPVDLSAKDSQTAREKSQAQMQGFKKKAEPQKSTEPSFTPATDVLVTDLDRELDAQDAANKEAKEFAEFKAWKAAQGNA